MTYADSADLDQTAPCLISSYTVCHSTKYLTNKNKIQIVQGKFEIKCLKLGYLLCFHVC